MSSLYAGMLCTCLLLSGCASLFSCISAAAHRLQRMRRLHLVMLPVCAVSLSLLLAQLPSCISLAPRPWTGVTLLLLLVSAGLFLGQTVWIRRHISHVSIKTSCDHLPCALCFALENGRPCLINLKMDELSHQITGGALFNANVFWQALMHQPEVSLENGQIWRFERTAMVLDGQKVYQIIGTDVTQSVALNRALAEDNRRLDALNRRLREYSRNVQAVTRDREALRAKVRIHDDVGHALLRTRQFLACGQGDAEAIRVSWQESIRLLLGERADEVPADSFARLLSAAQAIGVSVVRNGVFPPGGTEAAHLMETAAHECLTNLVRHADGRQLEMTGSKEADGWHILFRNDGTPPAGPIAEGGGLSSLRRQAEAAGCRMQVDYSPRFLLTLVIPEETKELLS